MCRRGVEGSQCVTLERVTLGRTGIEVSVAGLGCGGYSRLGLRAGGSDTDAENIVRCALDLGVNFFDTARVYGTEEIVGRVVKSRRNDVVLSTKTMFRDREGQYMPVERLIESLHRSLTRLNTDYVDVFSLHGVTPGHLAHCVDAYVPELQRQVDAGKIRHLGITESFRQDPAHEMLRAAIPMGCFDVVMVGFNLLNPGARDNVLPLCIEHNVGTQIMHAVRNALSDPNSLKSIVQDLIEREEVDALLLDRDRPLSFIEQHAGIASVVEAAYRFCRHEPGVSTVLTGTGSQSHLEANVSAIASPPLPSDVTSQLAQLFGQVRSVSGD